MGCSSSNVLSVPSAKDKNLNILPRLLNKLKTERQDYIKHHEYFDNTLLDFEVRNNFFFSEKNYANFENFFEGFYGKFKSKFDRYEMPYKVVKDVMIEKMVESQVKEDLKFREINVTEFIIDLLQDQDELSIDSIEEVKKTLINSNRFYAFNQMSSVFDLRNLHFEFRHYAKNLKFNANFQIGIMNIYLEEFKDNHIKELCEIILLSNGNLTTVSLIVKSGNNSNAAQLIDCVKECESVVSLNIIICNSMSGITGVTTGSLKQNEKELINFQNSLISLISIDRLISFSIINHKMTQDICENEIISLISRMKNLKFVLVEINSSQLDLMKKAVCENVKLLGVIVVLGGLNYNYNLEEKLNLIKGDDNQASVQNEFFSEIKKLNSNIKFCEVLKEFKLLFLDE